ncbi:MAG TPA: hypothetical protein ENF30_02380 [Candidatus Desulfofervidus auxilii]|uniref:Uncharacterized protein n=1 Tax=Desulfofervidus auxilii TaxID=1621989 RepID=A0A7V0IAC3_DESA2|nr:hypothetical protein [Candidatus Desulfofervidus auxilii]
MIGRFQVMATLQAARAYVLGLDLISAKSWGLNRAIFYAAAKRGFIKPKPHLIKEITIKGKPIAYDKLEVIKKTFGLFHLGDEMAYCVKINDRPMFVIGNQVQTEEDFYKQIELRFGNHFKECFKEAVKICRSYDPGILKSQRYFYETVYKPRRDELAQKWSQLAILEKKG